MLLNSLNKCICIINLIEINILFLIYSFLRRGTICPPVKNDGVLFVRMCKSMGYCLSACAIRRGTVCPPVQIDGVLCVRMCKNDGVLFVRGTICP